MAQIVSTGSMRQQVEGDKMPVDLHELERRSGRRAIRGQKTPAPHQGVP